VKIGQYLAKLWTKYNSLLFGGHPVCMDGCKKTHCSVKYCWWWCSNV